uniref:Uncharacterized protein n=1 Tax=Anopheles atroparvus TaxID=41427 RepID=A0A182IK40_ANOAO
MVAGRLLPPAILFVSGTTTCATELLLLLLLTVGCETIARGASSARIVAAVVDAGAAGDATGGGVGGAGFAIVPAAPMNAPAYFRSPHIGSKCFSFQGSSLLFSRSASERSFSWASGVNSPSVNRSRHSWQARAKNSLFSPDGFSRMPLRTHSDASALDGGGTGVLRWGEGSISIEPIDTFSGSSSRSATDESYSSDSSTQVDSDSGQETSSG